MDFMRTSWALIMLIVFGIMLTVVGCRSPLDALIMTANEVKAQRDIALVALEDAYQDHAQAVVYDKTLTKAEKRAKWDKVRDDFGPAFKAHESFRVFWKFLRSAVEMAKLNEAPDLPKLIKMLEDLRRFLVDMSDHPGPPPNRLTMEPL